MPGFFRKDKPAIWPHQVWSISFPPCSGVGVNFLQDSYCLKHVDQVPLSLTSPAGQKTDYCRQHSARPCQHANATEYAGR
jgi:hypothetical protein